MTDTTAKKKFIEYLECGGWKYKKTEQGGIVGRIRYCDENPKLTLRFSVTFENGCICNDAEILDISGCQRVSQMMRIVLDINKDLLWGGFDLDIAEKRLYYKIVFPYRLVASRQDMHDIFDDILFMPCAMAKAYIGKLLKNIG